MSTAALTRILSGIFFVITSTCSAANYYLSSSTGDDNRTSIQAQNSSTPWKSIVKLNSVTLASGDKIFFKRGDEFIGQVDVKINGVNYNAYGTGAMPVISGASPITGWTLHSGKIYKASTTLAVKNLFANGKQMTFARFPNTGFLTTTGGTSKTSVLDANLTQAAGYWTGATARILTSDWTYESTTIANHSVGQLDLTTAVSYVINSGAKYYLDNKLSELDVQNEWYYDAPTQTVYFYAPNGVNPSSLKVEGAVYDYGFKGNWNMESITIRNLDIRCQAKDGVWLLGAPCKNNTISGNRFSSQWLKAVLAMGSNITVDSNSISDVSTGIFFQTASNSFIRGNQFKRIGIIPGYGNSGVQGGVAIVVDPGTNVKCQFNSIDSTGYNGITFNASGSLAEYNVIRNALLTLTDGGALYCWGTGATNSIFRRNIVEYTFGSKKGVPNSGLAQGIYMDNKVSYITVDGNTVNNINGNGILVNAEAHHIFITNNVVYDAKDGGIVFADWVQNGVEITGCTVKSNRVVTLMESSYPLELLSTSNRYNIGTLDSNYYFNPSSYYTAQRNSYKPYPIYTLGGWQKISGGQDVNSKGNNFYWNANEVTSSFGNNLVNNSTFVSNTNGWGVSSSSMSSVSYVSAGGIEGGSLKFTMTGTGTAAATSPSFALVKDQWYELKFSVKSSIGGDLLVTTRNATNYTGLNLSRYFPITKDRKDYVITFKSSSSTNPARFDFQITDVEKDFILDNVSLTQVNTTTPDPRQKIVLFVNDKKDPVNIDLGDCRYKSLDNMIVTSVTLQGFSSNVLIKEICGITGLEGESPLEKQYQFSIFPNPSFGSIEIIASDVVREISIYNILGSPVEQLRQVGGQRINIEKLQKGLYLVKVVFENGNSNSRQLLVK